MKKLMLVLAFAACHFVASMAAFFLSVAAGMNRFDTGAAASSSEFFLATASAVLQFPVFPFVLSVFPKAVPFPLEYVPFLLNSLLWAAYLYLLAAWWLKRRRESGRRIHVFSLHGW